MINNCPYCKAEKFSLVTNEIRDSEMSIVRKCMSCGLVFMDSNEGFVSNIEQYYNENYIVDNSLICGEVISVSEHFDAMLKTKQQLLPALTKYLGLSFDILDVGCGTGSLLYLLKDYVKSCTGIEINREHANYAKAKVGCDTYTTSIEDLPKEQRFDAIILISVLEHMVNPFKTVVELKNMLKPGGFLFIEIPNCNEALLGCLPGDAYRKFFYHKAHLYYFTEAFFGKFLSDCGYSYEVSSRHDYTLINFLNWWFLGERQVSFEEAQCKTVLYDSEDDPFKKDMNNIFKHADLEFRKAMKKHKRGYILTFIAKLAD